MFPQSVCVLFINSRDAIKKIPSKLEGGRNVKGMKSGQGDFGGCKMVWKEKGKEFEKVDEREKWTRKTNLTSSVWLSYGYHQGDVIQLGVGESRKAGKMEVKTGHKSLRWHSHLCPCVIRPQLCVTHLKKGGCCCVQGRSGWTQQWKMTRRRWTWFPGSRRFHLTEKTKYKNQMITQTRLCGLHNLAIKEMSSNCRRKVVRCGWKEEQGR